MNKLKLLVIFTMPWISSGELTKWQKEMDERVGIVPKEEAPVRVLFWKEFPGYLRNEIKLDTTTPLWTTPGTKEDKAQGIVKVIYDSVFPSRRSFGAHIVSLNYGSVDTGYGQSLGQTRAAPKYATFNYRPIGSSGDGRIGTDVVVEVYDGKFDTMCHELSHAYNRSLCSVDEARDWSFFEEGQAVAVEMACSLTALDSRVGHLRWQFPKLDQMTLDKRWVWLRDYVGDKMGVEHLDGQDYAIAGFFMSQVYSLSNAGTIKYLISTKEPIRKMYPEILRSCNMDEETFWREMDRRLSIWRGEAL